MTTPVFQEIQVGTGSALTVASAALSAAADHLYLAYIYADGAGGAPDVSGVAGLGLTWSLVKAQCAGQGEHRVEVWKAIGAPSAGAVTATLASPADAAYIAVSRWSSVLASGPVGASSGYNTNGASGACSGGTDNDGAAGSITTTAAGSVVAVGLAHDATFTHTAGWTARVSNANSGGSLNASLETVVVPGVGATTVGGAGNLSAVDDWALVAVEILGALRVVSAATPRTLARFFDPHTGRPLRDLATWQ